MKELVRKGMGDYELRQALKKISFDKTKNNISVIINRGTFLFFLQCAEAMQLDKTQLK